MSELRKARGYRALAAMACLVCAALFGAGAAAAQGAGAANPPLPTIRMTAGMHVIHAEVADTAGERNLGLMNRTSLARNAGMLFVFDADGVYCFWMRNTLIPLSIAFLDSQGRIVNIADMEPLDESSHCPDAPIRYALEMTQGWYAGHGIAAGMRLRAEGLFSGAESGR